MNPEDPGRLGLVPVDLSQSGEDVQPFEPVPRLDKPPGILHGTVNVCFGEKEFVGQVLDVNRTVPGRESNEPFQQVFQFPDISRPVMIFQLVYGIRGEI